jgi:hypothetical protein
MSYIGKSLLYFALWSVGLLAAGIAAWQFYMFVAFKDSRGAFDVQGGGANLWLAVGAAGVACACVFLGIFRRINQTDEYHITS